MIMNSVSWLTALFFDCYLLVDFFGAGSHCYNLWIPKFSRAKYKKYLDMGFVNYRLSLTGQLCSRSILASAAILVNRENFWQSNNYFTSDQCDRQSAANSYSALDFIRNFDFYL